MKLSVLDLPDNNADLADWLEQHLLGLELADVIAGLEVFRHEQDSGPSLDTVLNGRQPDVLEVGLEALTEAQLISLLRHPRLLMPLQERVLTYGGKYWQDQPLSAEHRRVIEQGWQSLESQTSPGAASSAAPSPKPAPAEVGGGLAARRTAWAKGLCVAALVLVAVFGWQRFQGQPPAPAGWGWNKPGALATNVPAGAYLEQLAGGAEDWFRKRPEEPEALRTRLEQFRAGCDTLIAAPHTPLAEVDRDWLRERCSAWRDKIDEHLAALDSGTPVVEVRDAADATIDRLKTVLLERAAAVG